MAQRSRPSSKLSASRLVLPPYLDVAPRHGTRRNLDRPTYGPRIALVHQLLTGQRPMPWQQYLYDVMGEVDPQTGIRVYRRVFLTTMRQVGKTTIVRAAKVHRALDCTDPQMILFAAQDGIEAKSKWLEHAEMIKRSPLASRLAGPDEPTTSNGKENLVWANGSAERPLSSRPTSGHGVTLDFGVVTEAFSQTDDRYEQTMLPAMNTRPDAQYLVESTEGDATSLYWNERVDEHRARLDAEPFAPSRTAFFDWSFSPDDDPSDPAVWKNRIPALGYTIRLEEVQDAYNEATTPKKMRAFLRGFGNVRDIAAAGGSIFENGEWEDAASEDTRIVGDVTFSLDITPDRSYSTVGIAGLSVLGGEHGGIAKRERGTHWVVEYLVRKMEEKGASVVYVAANSPAALFTSELERVGLTVVPLSRAEVASAFASLYDAVVAGTFHYMPGQGALDAAVEGAAWTAGDVRLISRNQSSVDVSPLYAVAIARHGHAISEAEDTYDPLANIW